MRNILLARCTRRFQPTHLVKIQSWSLKMRPFPINFWIPQLCMHVLYNNTLCVYATCAISRRIAKLRNSAWVAPYLYKVRRITPLSKRSIYNRAMPINNRGNRKNRKFISLVIDNSCININNSMAYLGLYRWPSIKIAGVRAQGLGWLWIVPRLCPTMYLNVAQKCVPCKFIYERTVNQGFSINVNLCLVRINA